LVNNENFRLRLIGDGLVYYSWMVGYTSINNAYRKGARNLWITPAGDRARFIRIARLFYSLMSGVNGNHSETT